MPERNWSIQYSRVAIPNFAALLHYCAMQCLCFTARNTRQLNYTGAPTCAALLYDPTALRSPAMHCCCAAKLCQTQPNDAAPCLAFALLCFSAALLVLCVTLPDNTVLLLHSGCRRLTVALLCHAPPDLAFLLRCSALLCLESHCCGRTSLRSTLPLLNYSKPCHTVAALCSAALYNTVAVPSYLLPLPRRCYSESSLTNS